MFRIIVLVTVSLALTLSAQSRDAGGRNPSISPDTPLPDFAPKSLSMSGKVIVDDGTPLTDHAAIQSTCRGRIRTEAYTDSQGFGFVISNQQDNGVAADQAEDSA